MSGRPIEPPQVYLKPGEMYFSEDPCVVVTVLGSCLSVTMYHRKRRLGGICHGLLPQCTDRTNCEGTCTGSFKYVDCSIHRMVRLFEKHKVRRSEIEVKCFGGSDMFERPLDRNHVASVGHQNIASAEKILKKEGLPVHAIDVGGYQGRKIYFYTHTGEVLLKRLHRSGERPADPPSSAGRRSKKRTRA